MRIGSMFSGLLGGLDIACERVFNAETAWQLDITGASVRRRHWPDAVQVEADVTTVDPADLARVDVLCGGFPCQDLSVAGKGEGLDGARSGLYKHVLRFAGADPGDLFPSNVLRPSVVSLLPGAYQPQYVVLENVSGLLSYMPRLVSDFRALGYGLTYAVCEAADAGLPHLRRRVFVVAERGVAGRGRVEVDTSRRWAAGEGEREWNTIVAGDRGAGPAQHTQTLGRNLLQVAPQVAGKRLRPEWVECLMGVPQGWTEPTGPNLRDQLDAWRAPRGRYPATWDRSVPWPGFAWEPSRTLPDGPPAPGRPARIKGLGNGVVWQQAVLGLDACVNGCATGQVPMFGAAK